MKAPLFSKSGERIGEIELPDLVFGDKPNRHILWEIVRMYRWNQRHSIPEAKTRAEIRGSGAKLWPQKGMGRARHGDRYAPIFVGGGKAHGPKGTRSVYTIPRREKAKALSSTLSLVAKGGKVLVFEKLAFDRIKTKDFLDFLLKVGLERGKVLFLSKDMNREFYLSGRNLRGVFFKLAKDVNALDVLNSDFVGIEKEAISILEERVKA